MFLTLLVSVLVYAAILYVIQLLAMPEPGGRVATIIVSIIFAVHLLNTFGVFKFLDHP